MNRKWQLLVSLSVALVTSGQGALQFTNVSPAGFASTLNAVVGDNQSSFVAVGQSTLGLNASFNLTSWATSSVVTNAPSDGSLSALTFGAGRFVAGGVNASIFYSTDRTNWIRGSSKANNLLATVSGLTYNSGNGRFATVAVFPLASWSTDVAATWTAGSLTPPVSPFFSYRGLTAFGASSFIACGDSGTLRLSTDGGINWNEMNASVGSDVGLRAVASDGVQQLVAVGNNGRVIYSSNGGTNWQANSWIAANFGTVNLNGIAFLNPGFMVVGDGGRVFTITNITTTNWTVNTPTANTLLGVAAGTGGLVQGLSVMVGNGGTVIVAGTPPLAPINPIDQTVCAGSPNPPLSVSVVATDPLHPASVIAIDWFNAAGTRVATNTANFAPLDSAPGGPNAPSNYTYFAEARDLRTGFVSTNRLPATLTINPRPTSVVSLTGLSPICNGDSTTIQAVLTGIGPWNVTWSDGTNQTVNVSPATRTVSPANPNPGIPLTNIYTVTALTDTNCVANAGDRTGNATVVVNPTPTVDVVANQGPYCNTNAGLAINFSGPVAGTTFSWTSTADVGFGTSGPGNISAFTAINGGVAPVVATVTVTPTANGCVGTPRAFTVTVNPTPTVNVVANQGPYCNTNAGLAVNFSGPVVGTTFSWTSTADMGFGTAGAGNIGAFTATNGGTAPVVATVTVTPAANGCVGTPSTFTVTVNPTPTVDVVINQGPYCNTNAGLAISFSGPVGGTTFNWTSTADVGFGTSGAGNIGTFTAINGGVAPVVATVTVTPTANGCVGTPRTFTVTVNPTPTVNAVANQGPYCNTNAGLAISFSGPVGGTTFGWTSTVNVGFGTSGAGNIGAFTATNGGTAPVVATVTVTPTANGCAGPPRTFTVTVNPTPTVTSVANQTQSLSVGQMTSPVTLNGTATSFTWVNNNPSIGLGASGTLPAVAGTAVFGAFMVTNSGTATVTVTPHYSNVVDCVTATTTNFVITVINPSGPYLMIQMLHSTNVVLEWFASTNTALLQATNLTPPISWSTNGIFGAGTNRVTNSILFEPPNQFFRLTNAP